MIAIATPASVASHGKFVLNFLAGSQHSLLGHQLSLAFLQRLGAGFGRHRAAL